MFDSRPLSLGTGFLVTKAAQVAAEGRPMQDIVALLEEQISPGRAPFACWKDFVGGYHARHRREHRPGRCGLCVRLSAHSIDTATSKERKR